MVTSLTSPQVGQTNIKNCYPKTPSSRASSFETTRRVSYTTVDLLRTGETHTWAVPGLTSPFGFRNFVDETRRGYCRVLRSILDSRGRRGGGVGDTARVKGKP